MKRSRRAGGARLGRGFSVLLGLVSNLAYLAAFLALEQTVRLDPGGGTALSWTGLIATAMAFSFVHRPAAHLTGSGGPWWRGLAAGIQLLLLALLAQHGPELLVLGLCVTVLGIALSHSTQPVSAGLALVAASVQTTFALGLAPGDGTLALFLVQLTVTLAALIVLHGDVRREQVSRARRASVEPVGSSGAASIWARVRFASGLAALALAPTLLAVSLCSRDPRTLFEDLTGGSEEEAAAEVAERTRDEADAQEAWSADLGFGRGDPRRSDREVAWLRAVDLTRGEPLRDGRSLWLKVLCQDTFAEDRLRPLDVTDLERFDDLHDGRRDGWIRFVTESAPRAPLRIEILQRPMPLGRLEAVGGGQRPNILLRAEPLHGIRLEEVLFDPDGALVTAEERADWFDYAIEVSDPTVRRSRRSVPARTSARHGDERFVQLPARSPALAEVERRALEIGRGARDDGERLKRVLDHFGSGFTYSLEGTDFAGLEGVLDFLDRREGYCTSYASAAVLLLRCQGLSARSVSGYLVSEWAEEEDAYVVRSRHAHAWIEVWFAGHGWLAFDPTPSSRRAEALAEADREGRPRGLGAWSRDLYHEVRDFALAPEEPLRIGDLVATAAEAPGALLVSARRSPLVLTAVAAILLAALGWRLRRGLRKGLAALGVRPPGEAPSEFYYERLLRALARAGHAKRPGQTPWEFATRVTSGGLPALAGVTAVTDLYYRARYGGHELGREERRFIEGVIDEVRAVPRPAGVT